MSNSGTKGVHILVFPYPAQGHMLPLLDLTHQLALHGLTITILVTPKNLSILNPLLTTHPSSIHTLVFPFPHHPSLPSGVENIKDIGNHGNVFIINALAKLHDPIITWFKAHPNPPAAIISDFFLGWTHHLAHQLGIPRIAFFSSGAFLTAVIDHLWQNLNSVSTIPSSGVVSFPDIPNSPTFTEEQIPSVFRSYRKSDPDWEFIKDGMIANLSSWGSAVNTFDALESDYIDHLRKKMGHRRVFGVGPLSLLGGTDPVARGKSDSKLTNSVLAWLDERPVGSVLYVCFGSQKFLSKDQMEALATALEQSGAYFVWVLKSINGTGSLPDRFEERISGKGMVINGWAPQVLILAHRAVGGFLSHCGWNSVLEGIVAGVMILGWPMEADQYVNARLLVEYQGIGVRVCEGQDTVPDSAELARSIAESMSGDIVEKVKAKKLKDKAVEAVKEGGSSKTELDRFVRELTQLLAKTE